MTKLYKWSAGVGAVLSGLALTAVTHAATFLSVPTGTASQFTATVGSQFGDAGTLEIVVLAVAIPLFFYIVHQFMGLLPKGKARRS